MGTTGVGFTFWDAIDGIHPNTDVRVSQTVAKAGDIQRDWRNARAEIERLSDENARLRRIVDKLTAAPRMGATPPAALARALQEEVALPRDGKVSQ